jgi:sulfite exporter TauE/SafE
MHFVWTGFLLGFVGSLHCAGMCGPLVMAVPTYGQTRSTRIGSKLLYHFGRISTYCMLGAFFGLIGEVLSLAALQRWLSIAAGVGILVGLSFSALSAPNTPAWAGVAKLKRAFGTLLHRRTGVATFLLGAINGLLPCGLVYVAAAAALATGSFETSILYMLAFGVGTLPMMLGVASARRALKWIPGRYAQKLVPACVAIVAFLLVLRGMSLGIPYLSPNLSNATAVQGCH